MFKNKNDELTNLKNENNSLRQQIEELANSTNNHIIKQLPNGEMELNGKFIDNTTPVEYYNTSKATYGEMTMYRVGVESKKREMENLIQSHLEECDNYKNEIKKLNEQIDWYIDNNFKNVENINYLKVEIETLNKNLNILENDKNLEIENLNNIIVEIKSRYDDMNLYLENDMKVWKEKYESLIEVLENDIKNWKNRYLKLSNVNSNNDVITKYGEVFYEDKL